MELGKLAPGTIVRSKRTGKRYTISKLAFLMDGKSFLHYEGILEGYKGEGFFALYDEDLEVITIEKLKAMGNSTGGAVPIKEPIKSIKIELHWQDGFSKGSKGFETVHQLADFLKANPALAKAVGYVKK